jgi:catechol 2,3-dioxygenase-like lactoylglutathione lyase family enzyme
MMMQTEPHQRIVATKGAAVGRITGFNHIVLVCRDIDRSVRFYRDILGLKVIRTQPTPREEYERQYFFELPNGEYFSLYQIARVAERPQEPLANWMWPGSEAQPPADPEKLDHLAFNVDSHEMLLWFQQHLRDNGVPVSDVYSADAGNPANGFLSGRIYFYDPDHNPLEIASSDLGHPSWTGFDKRRWLRETDPVPALLEN